jgi:hypothetical protein
MLWLIRRIHLPGERAGVFTSRLDDVGFGLEHYDGDKKAEGFDGEEDALELRVDRRDDRDRHDDHPREYDAEEREPDSHQHRRAHDRSWNSPLTRFFRDSNSSPWLAACES